jgi:hypothetical protein
MAMIEKKGPCAPSFFHAASHGLGRLPVGGAYRFWREAQLNAELGDVTRDIPRCDGSGSHADDVLIAGRR